MTENVIEVPYCQFCGQSAQENYRWRPCCESCLKKAEFNDIMTIDIVIQTIESVWLKQAETPIVKILSPYYAFTIDILKNIYSEMTKKESE